MQKLSIIVIFIIFLVLTACFEKSSELYKKIAAADSLSRYDQRDSAKNILKSINISGTTDKERAYYNIISCRFSDTDTTNYDSLLSFLENYYKNTNEKNKLAEVYLKKATHYFRDKDMYDSAVYYLPRSEKLALEVNDYYLLANIKYLRSIFHYYERDMDKAKTENDLQFYYADKSKSQRLIAYATLDKAIAYKDLQMNDSAKLWLCAALLSADNIELHDKAFIYNALGALADEKDTIMAKDNFLKSLEIYPNIPAKKNLAKIYLKENNIPKVEELCNEGLQYEWPETKIEFLKILYQCKKLQKDHIAAAEIQDKIISEKDSVINILNLNNQKLAKSQFRIFDNKNTQKEINPWKKILILCGFVLVICTIIFFCRIKLNLLNKEIKLLKQEIETRKKHNSKFIQTGESFFNQVINNQPIISWTTSDMVNFIEYYRTLKPDFVETLDNDCKKLTPRYKIILVLEDMGKTIEEIMQIMSFGENAYYSAKSRINGAKK